MNQDDAPNDAMIVNGKLWCVVKTRKIHDCAICNQRFDKGARLYRPIGNEQWRSHRICHNCVNLRQRSINQKYRDLDNMWSRKRK